MKKTLIFVLLASSTPVFAAPMWDISDRWVCTTTSHVKMTTDGGDVRINEVTNRRFIDFAAGTERSEFSEAIAEIGEKSYTEGAFGGFNYYEVFWSDQPYPTLIRETGGEWWETVASGHSDDDRTIWIANYQCEPE